MSEFKMEICLHNLEDDDEAIIPTNYVEFLVEEGRNRVEYLEPGMGMWVIPHTIGLEKVGWKYKGKIYEIVGINHRGYLDVDQKSS